jgi:adenine-specific DNA-methyltransferase
MITPRLVLMRELLADTGSIYVHLDWHVGHYVKLVMDEIFGKRNFRNEIVWHYSGWNKQLQISFEKRHDTIFLYGKTDYPYFASFFEKWDSKEEYVKKRKQKVHCDESGREYVLSDAGGGERIKRYLDEVMQEGVVVDDVWHIDKLNNSANESVGYSTQKTKELLGRILSASCPQGGLVVDFFGGSGTLAATAEDLGLRWITSDLGKPAAMIMRKRLIDQDAKPFLYQAIGDYQVEAAKVALGRDFRIGDLSAIVLSLYGALPLPPDVNPQRNLGQIAGVELGGKRGSKTLVLADSPNKLTGAATLKKAIAQRDNLMGGWDRVVVLGWNFEPSIGETITALNDARLEVLVIPPDLMDRLKKKGGIDKLRGQVRFSSLQYLTLHPVERVRSAVNDGQEALNVRLKNYVLLSPEAINLDDANRAKLQAVANAEPLALIEYWAVDPDYEGQVFRSVWQDYRGNTANDADALRVVTHAHLTLQIKPGPRKVCVRVVDVFGFEAEVVTTVEAAA